MEFEVVPLRVCVAKYLNEKGNANYDHLTSDEVEGLIVDADFAIWSRGDRSDEARAAAWFAHVELTKRGIPPSQRSCLGKIPIAPSNYFQAVRKADAPYIDLLWLGQHMPAKMPKHWRPINLLAYGHELPKPDEIVLHSPEEYIVLAFDGADCVINRQLPVVKKCMAMGLPAPMQASMRWLCSMKVKTQLEKIENECIAMRRRIKDQGIKQIKDKELERRLIYFKAWKLAGGGTNWQEAASNFSLLTGETCSRQSIRDMINRMQTTKVVRRRRKRTVVSNPAIEV